MRHQVIEQGILDWRDSKLPPDRTGKHERSCIERIFTDAQNVIRIRCSKGKSSLIGACQDWRFNRLRLFAVISRSTQDGSYPQEQFVHIEWFMQIIICPQA